MEKVNYILTDAPRSCLFCSELMSDMDIVAQTCIVCSGMENKWKSQAKPVHVVSVSRWFGAAPKVNGGTIHNHLL